jgi:hypothetical protein
MTGIENDNKAAFMQAERELRRTFNKLRYLEIVNPVKIAKKVNESFREFNQILSRSPEYKIRKPAWTDYMRMDIIYLCHCTHVLFLDGYQDSKGSMAELYIAKKLGIVCADNIDELKELIGGIK